MKGRKPLPAAVRRLRGLAVRAGELEPTSSCPSPPDCLDALALAEWQRLTNELETLGLLTALDLGVVSLYCQAWSRWHRAEEQLKATGGEVVRSPNGHPVLSPWLSVSRQAAKQVQQLGNELGLSPASRTRISVTAANDPEVDAFEQWEQGKPAAIEHLHHNTED